MYRLYIYQTLLNQVYFKAAESNICSSLTHNIYISTTYNPDPVLTTGVGPIKKTQMIKDGAIVIYLLCCSLIFSTHF